MRRRRSLGVRLAPSVKSPGVKYVSGVLFFTRSVSLEGNRRIEKWKKIREEEKGKRSQGFERGQPFHNSSESSSLLRRFLLRRCLRSPFLRFCTKLLLLWSRGRWRNTLPVTLAVGGRISYLTLRWSRNIVIAVPAILSARFPNVSTRYFHRCSLILLPSLYGAVLYVKSSNLNSFYDVGYRATAR